MRNKISSALCNNLEIIDLMGTVSSEIGFNNFRYNCTVLTIKELEYLEDRIRGHKHENKFLKIIKENY